MFSSAWFWPRFARTFLNWSQTLSLALMNMFNFETWNRRSWFVVVPLSGGQNFRYDCQLNLSTLSTVKKKRQHSNFTGSVKTSACNHQSRWGRCSHVVIQIIQDGASSTTSGPSSKPFVLRGYGGLTNVVYTRPLEPSSRSSWCLRLPTQPPVTTTSRGLILVKKLSDSAHVNHFWTHAICFALKWATAGVSGVSSHTVPSRKPLARKPTVSLVTSK
jgi:hypothetical protein